MRTPSPLRAKSAMECFPLSETFYAFPGSGKGTAIRLFLNGFFVSLQGRVTNWVNIGFLRLLLHIEEIIKISPTVLVQCNTP